MAGMMGGAGGMQTGNPAASASQIGAAGAQGNQVTGSLTGPNFGVTPGNALIKNASAMQRATAQANIGLGARPGVPGVGSANAAGGSFGAQNPMALPAAGQFGMTVADGAASASLLGGALGGAQAGAQAGGLGGAQAGGLGGAQAGGLGGAQAGGFGGAQAGNFAGGAQAGNFAGGAQAGNFAGGAGGAAGSALQQATATGVNSITRTNSN